MGRVSRVGIALTLGATAAYFGSDDWPHSARQAGLVLTFLCYGAGLLVWLWYLCHLSQKRILAAMGALFGLGCLGAVFSQPGAYRLAYLLTHPYALLLNLLDPPFFLDARALKSWANFTLGPYLLLLELTVAGLLLASGLCLGWRLYRRATIRP